MDKVEIVAKNYTVPDCADLLSAVDKQVRTAYIRGFRRGVAKTSRHQEAQHTNADNILAITDEMQLAVFLASVDGCPYNMEIPHKCEIWGGACVSCWSDWLNQEAE